MGLSKNLINVSLFFIEGAIQKLISIKRSDPLLIIFKTEIIFSIKAHLFRLHF